MRTLFSFTGRLRRLGFGLALVGSMITAAAAVYGSFLLLAPAGAVLGPLGINAGLIQTGFLALLLAVMVWIVLALLTKRLRDRGRPVGLALIAVVPPVLVAVGDGLLTIRPLVAIDQTMLMAVYYGCGAIGLWLLAECLFLPSADDGASGR